MRIECNVPCPADSSRSPQFMFPYDDEGRIRPPAVVTTMGQLKQQYNEPDWAPAPQKQKQQQQQQQQYQAQMESREPYWGGNARAGGNSLLAADERDARMPANNNFQFAAGMPANNFQYSSSAMMSANDFSMGMGMGVGMNRPTMSPRQYQPQQEQMSSREAQSYKAAIQSVNDSMKADGRGSVTALRGLWKVFDAAVSELGTELNDSLSNKAIFEANVMQENMFRQGRKMSDWEKKSDALSRKNLYEASLKSTMLRLRGSFADVILGSKKEIQSSIDKSFAMKTAELEINLEKSYVKKISEKKEVFARMSNEMDKKIHSANKESNRLRGELNQSTQRLHVAEAELAASNKKLVEVQRQAETQRDFSSKDISRLHGELNQAEHDKVMLQAKITEFEQSINMIQAQMAQERESYCQAIANAEQGRDDTVQKLSSTLETLQMTCASASELETKLTEVEDKLHRVGEKLRFVEHDRHREQEAANQRWGIESERAGILQKKLDSEVKNKNALITVQKEMEKHLSLERERGDLLQQELHSETQSKEEMVHSLQEADRQRRGELDQLREQLNRTSEANTSLKSNLERLQDKFEQQVEALHSTKEQYSRLTDEFQDCKDRLEKTSEMNSLLEVKVERMDAKVQDQVMDLEAARMSEAEVENSLAESLQHSDELETSLRRTRTEMQQRVEVLESRLRESIAEMQSLTEQISGECTQKAEKVAQLEDARRQLDVSSHTKSEVESERDGLTVKLGALEKEHSELQKLNSVLEAESDGLKDKLTKIEGEYGEDRSKIAKALAGFDDEITNAESKLNGVMDELEKEKARVAELLAAQEEAAGQKKIDDELNEQEIEIEQKMRESERKTSTEELTKVKVESEKKMCKYEADIGVYAEAIKMLQKQVDILGEMTDNDECNKCGNNSHQLELMDLKMEEARHELRKKMNDQKLDYEYSIQAKDADIATLQDKCDKREASMAEMESLCVKARQELLRVRRQMYIQSHEGIDHSGEGAIEVTPCPGKTIRLQDMMKHFDSPNVNNEGGCHVDDVAADLDGLLSSIEAHLSASVRNCGALEVQGKSGISKLQNSS